VLKVGLTGGIGCGKTTVSNLFSKFGIPIVDADEISRSLVEAGQTALQTIKDTFGSEMLLENGNLNRSALKTHIFQNPAAKQQLEAILHPLIFQEISNRVNQLSDAYCILSIPLLFETHAESLVDRILVIDCDKQTQINRVQQRDNLLDKQIETIISSQVSREFRLLNADDLLKNTKNKTALAKEVKKLHNFYLSLSLDYDTPLL
jgi:dephospho-CoA kinase